MLERGELLVIINIITLGFLLNFTLCQLFTNCGPCIRNVSITCELTRNTNLGVQTQTYRNRNSGHRAKPIYLTSTLGDSDECLSLGTTSVYPVMTSKSLLFPCVRDEQRFE